MIGKVDGKGRALLDISVASSLDGNYRPITSWVDTAFDGHLVFSAILIEELGLEILNNPGLFTSLLLESVVMGDRAGRSSPLRCAHNAPFPPEDLVAV